MGVSDRCPWYLPPRNQHLPSLCPLNLGSFGLVWTLWNESQLHLGKRLGLHLSLEEVPGSSSFLRPDSRPAFLWLGAEKSQILPHPVPAPPSQEFVET